MAQSDQRDRKGLPELTRPSPDLPGPMALRDQRDRWAQPAQTALCRDLPVSPDLRAQSDPMAQPASFRGHRDPQALTERLAQLGLPDLPGQIQSFPVQRVQQALTALLVLPERQARKVLLALTAPSQDQPDRLAQRELMGPPELPVPQDLLALLVRTARLDLRDQLALMASRDLRDQSDRKAQLAQP